MDDSERDEPGVHNIDDDEWVAGILPSGNDCAWRTQCAGGDTASDGGSTGRWKRADAMAICIGTRLSSAEQYESCDLGTALELDSSLKRFHIVYQFTERESESAVLPDRSRAVSKG